MSFRENLQYLRGTRNMTQEQLTMLLGVSRQAISKWESEKAYPEMDKSLMICDLFGVTLDDLVMGDVRRPNSGIRESTADTSTNSGSVGVVAAIAQPVGFRGGFVVAAKPGGIVGFDARRADCAESGSPRSGAAFRRSIALRNATRHGRLRPTYEDPRMADCAWRRRDDPWCCGRHAIRLRKLDYRTQSDE